MAGRKTSLASLAGSRVEDVPGQTDPTLVRLPLARLVPTPLNPRKDFGTDEELTELGESMRRRQLQPVVVVSRAAYLKLFPEHADSVGEASYVITNGERRYRASAHVGLHSLEAVIREEVAASRQVFLDAVLSENIDRKNFDPIEEARGVEAMVAECGSATVAAEQFKRTSAWVSQRRVLLRLTPEIQQKVSRREVPLREAREWGRLPAEQQLAAYTAWEEARLLPRPRAQRAAEAVPAASPEPLPGQDPGSKPQPSEQSASGSVALQRDPAALPHQADAPLTRAEALTGPAEAADVRHPAEAVPIPWRDPHAVNRLARDHMTPEGRATLARLLTEE